MQDKIAAMQKDIDSHGAENECIKTEVQAFSTNLTHAENKVNHMESQVTRLSQATKESVDELRTHCKGLETEVNERLWRGSEAISAELSKLNNRIDKLSENTVETFILFKNQSETTQNQVQ